MSIQFVDLGRQYASIKSEVDDAVLAAVASTAYILGEEVAGFEQEFASFCGTAHCIGVNSGTAAIQLGLEALGVGLGDEVIAPANTFIASVLPILRLGARPVLVDCDEQTATMDVEAAAAAITARTKVVLAVHLYGEPADVRSLAELCAAAGIDLVEDAAQAHGARFADRPVGGFGRLAAFSFYPSKNLGAYGDGGAVTTDDAELAEHIGMLRNLGQRDKYVHVVQGWNERLDTLQAAVLRVKLRHLERWNELRRSHARAYAEALAETDVRLPATGPEATPVWHLYVIRTDDRDALRDGLAERGISTGLHYRLPLHLQPALEELGYAEGDFPVTEEWASMLLSLPMFPELRSDEIETVAEAVAELTGAGSSRTPSAGRRDPAPVPPRR